MCMPVAGNEAKRESEIYLSDANSVDIVLNPGIQSEFNNFIVKFSGIQWYSICFCNSSYASVVVVNFNLFLQKYTTTLLHV